jgi:hypothetical protein
VGSRARTPLPMTPTPLKSLTLTLLLVAAACMTATAARAHGDPASEYLVAQQAFVSPNARVSTKDRTQLIAVITALRRAGYPVRVAIIQSRYDLGAVSVLDKKPRLYARFLSRDLRLVYAKRLLVVMPNGYGISDDGKAAPADQAVLDRLSPAGTQDGARLVAAAVTALRALGAADGVDMTQLPHGSSRSFTDRWRPEIVGLIALLVLAVASIRWNRRDRRSDRLELS